MGHSGEHVHEAYAVGRRMPIARGLLVLMAHYIPPLASCGAGDAVPAHDPESADFEE